MASKELDTHPWTPWNPTGDIWEKKQKNIYICLYSKYESTTATNRWLTESNTDSGGG